MKNQREFSNRTWLSFGLFVALGLAIFGRILWIQGAEHEQWNAVGERFESSVQSIAPARGQIYASNGSVLATSVPVFEVRWDSKSEAINWDTFDRELDDLALNDELLRNLAHSSGGQFFLEEETHNLVNLLESIDRKKVIPSNTVLWSSYWWFAAIVGLLTAEWILRKKAGFV